ncbi:2-aminoethylphosphonate--pyruvate transaminase [Aeromonas hydrophila]|uniref:2-aminoethylphosphonate--pyruvate transaminase n=1 Tax=Aeromonas hydrophila TaxID=644 RepID=UPI0019155176|nr:2-aminoethylphosphonate--pyruvate transaminase [Aeromonas hydrophila]MBQ4676697.1 2-aminoethylphosphonate--pyruvate transaminase [Aeromonas hydrophila]MBW3813302.1 2-aminoethylphosphonate--pyruvate transaminase [Aeromonas hydrophila]MCF7678534.1 2-aminoethylphosphonate--pyruvate transaminase [Aeromonas hydrophila]MCF7691582.1 2-aminoethylphosphonate--pyruvate transaminase [Aeromonas hydrophila]MCF7772382.1 2-aminoethylphosphonate--pyruvate transaminase [Aeromonas hydrophila]
MTHIPAAPAAVDYLLLTPGPLSTTATVRAAMLQDSCTWDADYNQGVVEPIRRELVRLATGPEYESDYSAVLLQGSGSYVVESVLGSAIGVDECLLIINNGAYGARMGEMARCLGLRHHELDCGETTRPEPATIEAMLVRHPEITHLAMVHCETTTGMLNPLEEVAALCQCRGIRLIVDAMSSFGGIPIDMGRLGIEFLISSANKCIQGVPGFGFVIARRAALAACAGRARSVSLDLHAQWQTMEQQGGKWRFTSPTHTVLAFAQALRELDEEGGIAARHRRYSDNQRTLVDGMAALGFAPLLPEQWQSPIITAFYSPAHPDYRFADFYQRLKAQGFVIYPGKVSQADCFRIGNIGDVTPERVRWLLAAMASACYWQGDAR